MTDPETPTFQVVDRRSSVQTSESDAEHSTSFIGSEAESGVQPLQDQAQTEVQHELQEAVQDELQNDASTDSEHRLPDPSALLSYVAMQMDSHALASGLLGIFAGHAWRAMGLMPHPVTGEIKMDLPEAQLAIDCVQFLLGKVEKELPEPDRREMQRRLNDLRMNYLERMRK